MKVSLNSSPLKAFPRKRGCAAATLFAIVCSACSPSPAPASIHKPFFSLRRPLFGFHREQCDGPVLARAVERVNTASLYLLHFAPFGRPETGWATYAPAVEGEIGTSCAVNTGGFANALGRWQKRRGLSPTGIMTDQTFEVMKVDWQDRRPFVNVRAQGVCPTPPADKALANARPEETYEGKAIQLRIRALAAYRHMVADARRQQPQIAAKPELLRIFSAYRSPAYDAARCAKEGNCQGVVRAACSAHRTGLAMDIVLDTAPGYAVDSSADPNRLVMAKGVAYRWLVSNARQYGFINYAFEPWHWEWTGEKP